MRPILDTNMVAVLETRLVIPICQVERNEVTPSSGLAFSFLPCAVLIGRMKAGLASGRRSVEVVQSHTFVVVSRL